MSVEEEYQDVLQNLESAIIAYYRAHPDLIDAEVETAISWLVKLYNAEAQGKTSSYRVPRGVSGEVGGLVQQMCEWRLGRQKLSVEELEGQGLDLKELEIEKLEPREIAACLKRIQSSIKFWTKKAGRQGYLNFVAEFV